MERILRLPGPEKEMLLRRMESGGLSRSQRTFVMEYCVDGDRRRAVSATGRRSVQWTPRIEEAVERRMAVIEARCDLNADYVRQYITDVLELCPTDYFILAPDGSWAIDPDEFKVLPDKIRRLVQGAELTYIRGVPVLRVQFVSKQAALALAAKFTLTQKVDATVNVVPWDQIAEGLDEPVPDCVEEELRRLEAM